MLRRYELEAAQESVDSAEDAELSYTPGDRHLFAGGSLSWHGAASAVTPAPG